MRFRKNQQSLKTKYIYTYTEVNIMQILIVSFVFF